MSPVVLNAATHNANSRQSSIRHRRLLLALLASTSALVTTVTGAAQDVQIDRKDHYNGGPMIIERQGTAGKDAADAYLFGWDYATPGGDGGVINQVVNAEISIKTSTPAISLHSVGGRGGNGKKGALTEAPGEPGGKGQAVTVEAKAAISGGDGRTGTQTTVSSVISLLSQGGHGGIGHDRRTGGGGSGGAVSATIRGNVNASGSYYSAISAQSIGGDAGHDGVNNPGGTDYDRRQTDAGGNAGWISVFIDKGATVSTSGENSSAVVLSSIGGSGSKGGDFNLFEFKNFPTNGGAGGSVALTNQGTVITNGNNSSAILAQSVGGDGGSSMKNGWEDAVPGANGASGSIVDINNTGRLSTAGDYSFGIIAQSVGGSGGAGGDALVWTGGNGGAGGNSGKVTIKNTGVIETRGVGSIGIMAQSVAGGFELDAFNAVKPAVSTNSGGAGGRSGIWGGIWRGGNGGSGGKGGDVTISFGGENAVIRTAGSDAHGILGQSIGGGGGAGGGSETFGAALAVAVGGTGGPGGDGGNVTLTLGSSPDEDWIGRSINSVIETSGKGASGVFAQSVGGGGGAGGTARAISAAPGASVAVAVGGTGGDGGKSGTVTVQHGKNNIITRGENAFGIQAISIGGGGGSGGLADAMAIAFPFKFGNVETPSLAISVAVGGTGGKGGVGLASRVTNTDGNIDTYGVGGIGVQVQSIGGGGNAGSALAYALAISSPSSTALSVTTAIGGTGGDGGSASKASYEHTRGHVITRGDGAIGVQVQSIGGGGGNAGASGATSNSLSFYRNLIYSVSIGGKSGGGGHGAETSVVINSNSLIETHGAGAAAIMTQSIGGGGGNAGSARPSAAAGLSFDKTLDELVKNLPIADSAAITVGVGGTGGGGGNGGAANVSVAADSILRTFGEQSAGVMAQSIGGGGGAGGDGSSIASATKSVNVTLAGSGGVAGRGGAVTVNNNGTIYTEGSSSHAIFAQSIGGGGGTGGSLTATSNKNDTVGEIWSALKKAVGAEAFEKWAKENGNDATKEKLEKFIKDIQNTEKYKELSDAFKKSDFYKELTGFKKKYDEWAKATKDGSVKQKKVGISVSLGGNGGSGNVGGEVKLKNEARGIITTQGDNSYGIFGQSVGGGGGMGGMAYGTGVTQSNLLLMLGGSGGSGNSGGGVTVENAGVINTSGLSSYGIFAQSVGGGGGLGVGAFSSKNKVDKEKKAVTIAATLGGSGGSGGHGNAVAVTNTGNITTSGDEAFGILAQSIGAGGGNFVMNPSKSGESDKTKSGDEEASDSIVKELLKAIGIEEIPSPDDADATIPPKSYGITLGGSGGASGNGGRVWVTHSGDSHITTHGIAAFGIFAQSVGGGGGTSNAAPSVGGVKYAASIGGKGGAGGHGGAIDITLGSGSINTTGDYATAVYAQSIGGGGGYAGSHVLQGYTIPFFLRSGGAGGNGGAITITGNNAIEATGDYAHGIFAQSIGGGGGTASQRLDVKTTARDALKKLLDDLASLPGTAKILDNIDKLPEPLQDLAKIVANSADTAEKGAQWIKNLMDSNAPPNGTGGAISINVGGHINVRGREAYAIYAQSGTQDLDGKLDARRLGGNINIKVSGTVASLGSSVRPGAAIAVDGGNRNRIEIAQGATVRGDRSNRAIAATFGDDTIVNYGTLIGDIDLSARRNNERSEINVFENHGIFKSDGQYNSYINLSSDQTFNSQFINRGTIDLSNNGQIETLRITNGTVHLGGTFIVDVDSVNLDHHIDAIDASDTAYSSQAARVVVEGVSIVPNAVNGLIKSTYPVITTNAGNLQISNAATVVSNEGSPITWNTNVTTDKRNKFQYVNITPSADFVGRATFQQTETQTNLLNSMQNAWDSSIRSAAPFFAQFANLKTQNDYLAMVNNMTVPARNAEPVYDQVLDARASLSASMSCPLFEGDTTMLRENSCVWSRISGSRAARFRGGEGESLKQTETDYRVGAQWEIKSGWFLGATAGYSTSKMHTTNHLTHLDGEGGDVSIALKYQTGPWLFAGSIHGGYLNLESVNRFYSASGNWSETHSNDVYTGGMRLRAAYEHAFSNWYVRPYLDVDVIHSYMPGYTMKGHGYLMHVNALREWSFALAPSLEAGSRIDLGEYGWLRPYASVGAVFMAGRNNEDLEKQVVLTTTTGAAHIEYTSSIEVPRILLDMRAGMQLFAKDQFEVKAEYKAQVGNRFLNHEGSLRLGVKF